MNIEDFLHDLENKLPAICTDKDLVKHISAIFKNPSTLTRMRSRGQAPSHFHISPNVYYLKSDVLLWLRNNYRGPDKQETGEDVLEIKDNAT